MITHDKDSSFVKTSTKILIEVYLFIYNKINLVKNQFYKPF